MMGGEITIINNNSNLRKSEMTIFMPDKAD